MKRLKNLTLIFFLPLCFLIVFGICKSPKNITFADSTTLGETTATAKLTANGETTYYINFGDAVVNAPKNSTITLLKDSSMFSESNKELTIDLNGKTLSSSKNKFSYSTITIEDSVGSGKISGEISFYASKVTVKSASKIDQIVLTDNSGATILGGKINKVNVIKNNLTMSGGEIDNLCIYDTSYIHFSGGTINNFTFVSIAENFNMLDSGYVYARKTDNTPLKITEMTSSTQANIIKCPHPTFTNYLCDYCGYACEHTGHFNSDGICDACTYVCAHENISNDKACLKCNQQIEANLKNSSTSKNYIKFEDAISNIQSGDILTIYNNINTTNSLEINTPCTIDLNGHSAGSYYMKLNNTITVTDSVGNGFIAVTSSSSTSQIKLCGADTTIFLLKLNKDRLKFYSGQIYALEILDGTIDNILPAGYILVKHDKSNSNKLTKQESNIGIFSVDSCYLTCEICTHDLFDESLVCQYCGKTLSQEQVLQSLSKNLQTAKQNLSESISKKEDITTINSKVKTLNETISNAETICKTYTDSSNEQLKQDLESLIETAKQEAISSSNTALEQARSELMNVINSKVNAETYNSKVEALTTAIQNAELASKNYADSQDLELKTQLQTKIDQSKNTLQEANNIILERLNNAESKIENNTKSINSLRTTLIILSIIFTLFISFGFIALFLFLIEKNNKNGISL